MNHDEEEKMNHEGHEDHEGGGSVVTPRHRMRLRSPLSADAERVMSESIGCALRVHRALGPGFLESIYRKAMQIELNVSGLSYESERAVFVKYRDVEIAGQRIDLIVGNQVVVELKAVVKVDDVHRAQLISYLRTTGLRGGLLINFRVALLRDGLQRIVL